MHLYAAAAVKRSIVGYGTILEGYRGIYDGVNGTSTLVAVVIRKFAAGNFQIALDIGVYGPSVRRLVIDEAAIGYRRRAGSGEDRPAIGRLVIPESNIGNCGRRTIAEDPRAIAERSGRVGDAVFDCQIAKYRIGALAELEHKPAFQQTIVLTLDIDDA